MTLSAYGPQTTVSFVRGGVEIANAQVPGYLLQIDVPRSVELRRQPSGDVQLVESPDPLLECCGEILLPWVNRSGAGSSTLTVPSPTPFQPADIETMWQARNRLVSRRRPPTSGAAEWSRLERAVRRDVDWAALDEALRSATLLLAKWPIKIGPAVAWLPFDRTGGRLLVGATEGSVRAHRLPPGTARSPAITARRTAAPSDRTLHALTAVTSLLADRLGTVVGLEHVPDLRDRLVGVFREVAARSNPSRPVADPPPSAWPSPFLSTYSTCLRALSTVRNLGPGNQTAPLSEVWELYQAWVAETIREALDAALGTGLPTGKSATCIGRWRDGVAMVELHYQPRIPTHGKCHLMAEDFVAAIGDLEPDLMLVRAEGTVVRSLVLDAKKRSTAMLAEDLTVNASKYLWGIRRHVSPNVVPVIEGAVMVAPLGGPAAVLRGGLADVLQAHPAHGMGSNVVSALLNVVRGEVDPASSTWHRRWD